MKILLSELRPNPFRDLKRLPTVPGKVEVLKKSIQDTSFWDNIVARKAPNGAGGYEIAYGHNRLEALRQLKYEYIDIPVRDIDNTMMAKIMARENHEEWGAFAEIDAETIRAIVQALGEGKISLPPVKANVGYIAPSFEFVTFPPSSQGDGGKTYSAQTLADFLDWPPQKVKRLLGMIAFKETSRIGKEISFSKLTSTQADKVLTEIRRVIKETEDESLAKRIGKQLTEDFRISSDRSDIRAKKDKYSRAISTETATERTNELMRQSRVRRYLDSEKKKKIEKQLLAQNRQVADFLKAIKVWSEALDVAMESISKFSPEARNFSIRKVNLVRQKETLLKGRMGEGAKK